MTTRDAVQRGGRALPVVVNDRESETRTPANRLHRIPDVARDPFAPCPPPPLVRPGEYDLTRIGPGRPRATGEAIAITGRILDEDLRPVRRTVVEVWGANAHGRYSHVIDASRNDAPLDPNFYGFGRLLTDDDGQYRLRTIKPGAYIARKDITWWRPPHVHFSIVGAGVRLVTQMYFPDEALNEKDFIFLAVPPADRDRIIAAPIASRSADPTFTFDIVIRGRFQTPSDADD
jgi:protocatechuate 3,4-dioxygenase beta subunit